MTGTNTPASREMARQLLARGTAGIAEPAAAAAMQRLCTRISENLRRSVGDDGYNALLARSRLPAETAHPALSHIFSNGDAGFHLDGVVVAADRHGVPVVAAALETLFATLIDVLGGLIGADMVLNLLELDESRPHTQNGRQPE
jgi:hypothetical protein